MGIYGRRSIAVSVVVVALALAVGLGASSADSSPEATVRGAKLVQFVRPTGNTLAEKGTGPIRVIVRLRAGARLTKVHVDGLDVTRVLRAEGGGYYGGLLLSRHLHYGFNDAFAQATGRNGSRATAHVRFVVAQRDDRLLRLTSFSIRTAAAPVQVGVREQPGTHVRAILSAAQGVSARVYVNDRRVDRAFSLQGSQLIVRLGAGEGLRFGRNLLQILVHKTHPYKGQSSYDIESRTVYIGRHAPIAGAGGDQTTTQGDLVRLDGQASKLPPGLTKPVFRWKIVSAPQGSKARLRNASGSLPTLVPDRAGVYDVRVSVRGTRRAPRAGLGARDVSAASATRMLTGISNDTTAITATPDIPPAGVALNTLPGKGGLFDLASSMLLDGKPVPGTGHDYSAYPLINYAVINRETLDISTSGSVSADVDGIQKLGTIIDGYSGLLDHLVVLNWARFDGDIAADRNALDTLLQKIGAQKLTDSERQAITLWAPGDEPLTGSAVGVAGAPPSGSAFVKFGDPSVSTDGRFGTGGMFGYLRKNNAIEPARYDFVFTDPVDFDTDANQTATDNPPAQLTIKVGDATYTKPNPGGGVSGFHLLLLSPKTLTPAPPLFNNNFVFTTNAANGAEQPNEVQKLVDQLQYAVASDRLVIVQAFGTPHGNDAVWDQAALQIQALGGTRQVFDAMNAADPRSLNGEDPSREGPYAFVGVVGSSAPVAEASYSLNGLPGRLRGVLMRARDGGYEPMIAGPPRRDGQSPVNTELIHIADQAPQPFPAFKETDGTPIPADQALAVQAFLGGRDVAKLCLPGAVCDIRKQYYLDYGADWGTIADILATAADKCATPPPDAGFTAAQCNSIRLKLRDEMYDVARVKNYFGPLGLQQPFGAAGTSALADLTKISQEIKDTLWPPPGQPPPDNTTSSTLQAISFVLLASTYIPNPATPEVIIAGTLYAAFAAGAYFTRSDGSPDLIGPQLTTTASKLGVELSDRYNQAGTNLNDLGRLIVGDYGKLSVVVNKIDADPAWRLGDVAAAENELRLAASQTIYTRLVPLAYPVMYDLGQIGNARDWGCDAGLLFPFRRLFGEQSDSAQFIGRFPTTQYAPTIAVARARAVGSGSDARILGIPASIADPLFKPVVQGGLGLSKLQFYSPRNGFRYFPAEPNPARQAAYKTQNGDFATVNNLHLYPYGTGFTDYKIVCVAIADPPGDSG